MDKSALTALLILVAVFAINDRYLRLF